MSVVNRIIKLNKAISLLETSEEILKELKMEVEQNRLAETTDSLIYEADYLNKTEEVVNVEHLHKNTFMGF